MFLKKIMKSASSHLVAPNSAEVSPVQNPSFGKRTCVYYSNWSIYERKHFPTDIPLDKVTNVFLAFHNVDPMTGEVRSGDDYADYDVEIKLDEKTKVKGLFAAWTEMKRRHLHLKTSLSIGGWSNRENFAKGIDSSSKLEIFVRSAINILALNKLDGIDLDWEYPKNKKEACLYLTLIKKLREGLRKLESDRGIPEDTFLLTMASPAFEDKLDLFNIAEMDKHLSFWNLMTYDFAGEWSERVGYHCNLFKIHPGDLCADDGVKYFINKGINTSKLTLGMANYGRSFTNTEGYGYSFNGVGKGSSDEEGIWNYNALTNAFPQTDCIRFYDDNAEAAYIFIKDRKFFLSYDSPRSVRRKAKYVNDMKLGGGMWWESCGDFYSVPERCLLLQFVEVLGGVDVLDRKNNITVEYQL